ncbi:uncharacterized protein VTP21DRAFT_7858 [Calcarisporiella thermophila]|uniref:uncharacterized protein n=1 Tax=Calcarisporiella thermophila TaxID=911321 RepID=UPI0037447EA7
MTKKASKRQAHLKRRDQQTHKLKKDPGVPDLKAFKDRLASTAKSKKIGEERDRQREARSSIQNQGRSLSIATSASLNGMLKEAANRANSFVAHSSDDNMFGSAIEEAAATGKKDNSRKAYFREFKKVLEGADVILEILDARDPLGTRTKQVERMIMDSGVSKRIILVLNKIDLVPRENVEQWLKYLRNEYPTVAFKASTQTQRYNLGQRSGSALAPTAALNSSESLGADALIQLLKNYSRSANMKSSISVGVLGFPNVGKSSVINSLKRARVCGVGATPGFTKVAQEVHLDRNIKLLDCPGIVFSTGEDGETAAEVLLRNCVKVELLEDPIAPVGVILSRCNKEQLKLMYKVPDFDTTEQFLALLAQRRGKLKPGGIPDLTLAGRQVLNDWNSGRIKYYTIPPAVKGHIGAEVVQAWSTEFELSEADRILEGVKSQKEFDELMMADDEFADGMADDEIAAEQVMDMDGDSISAHNNTSDRSIPVVDLQPIVKSTIAAKPQRLFTDAEKELNQQSNKQLRKKQKQDKKRARKMAALYGEPGEEEMEEDDEPVNFGEFSFSQLPQDELPHSDEDEEL